MQLSPNKQALLRVIPHAPTFLAADLILAADLVVPVFCAGRHTSQARPPRRAKPDRSAYRNVFAANEVITIRQPA